MHAPSLLILATLLVAILAQNPTCSNDAGCNNYGTSNGKFCELNVDPLLRTCKDRPTHAVDTTQTSIDGMCTNSVNLGAGATVTCGKFASAGCDVADDKAIYFRCINSTRNIATKKCEFVAPNPAPLPITYVGENARCDQRLVGPTTRLVCGRNLACIDNICRALLKEGENCIATQIPCGVGLTCDNDFCVAKHSRYPGEKCKTNDACISESCVAGVCTEQRAIKCWHNAHCGFPGLEVCYIASGRTSGFCTRSANVAHARGDACKRQSCSTVVLNNECEECDKFEIEEKCADWCTLRPDARIVTDGNVYNCQALTKTVQPANTCNILATVTNCPSEPISAGMTQGISLVIVVLAMIFAF